jgi:hypothetical protein
MKRFVLMAAMITALTLLASGRAEARIFESQPNWWNSGRTCIDSRNPPGLAWDDLAPRACRARPEPALGKSRADAPGDQAGFSLASAAGALADKFAAKPESPL